jgi:broad specificity phosphatase PhoE
MVRILLVRPGATPFDDQGRIKGSLDMPLSDKGRTQVAETAHALSHECFDVIYVAPCESAQSTARELAKCRRTKIKTVMEFRNVDHGLWHGKLIDEVRRQLPRVFRLGQEDGEAVCPPGGESCAVAKARAKKALLKIVKRHKGDSVALVIPDPMASVVRGMLQGVCLEDLWQAECDAGGWEAVDVAVPVFA